MKKQIPVLIAVVVFILAIRASVIEPFRIPSSSMLPGIATGDYLFASKFHYGFRFPFIDSIFGSAVWLSGPRIPRRGDIVIFETPESSGSTLLIKRVIGVPGDKIATEGKNIIINGQPLAKTPIPAEENQALINADWFDPDIRYNKTKLQIFEESLGDLKYQILEDDSFEAKKNIPETIIPENSFFVLGDNRDDTNDSRDFGVIPVENIRGKGIVIWLSYRMSLRDSRWSFRWDRIGKKIR